MSDTTYNLGSIPLKVKDNGDGTFSFASQAPTSSGSLVTLASLLAGEDLTNNVLGTLQKPSVGSQYAPGVYQNAGANVTANIKASAGNIYSIRATSINGGLRYLQLHNTATTPASGATAQDWFLIPAGTAALPAILELDSNFFAPSEDFATGIAFAFSTTPTTYTPATASDHTLHARYV